MKLHPPGSTAVVDVHQDDVERYESQGWTRERANKGAPARSKPSGRKPKAKANTADGPPSGKRTSKPKG